jgi:hypothetical protein
MSGPETGEAGGGEGEGSGLLSKNKNKKIHKIRNFKNYYIHTHIKKVKLSVSAICQN